MKTRFYIFLSLAFMLLTQTGCIYENASVAPECGSADTESLVINLNLTVPSAATGTRSADDDLDLATKEESYIDVTNGDYQICVFDKDGTYVGDKLSEIECIENGVSDGIINYTLTA